MPQPCLFLTFAAKGMHGTGLTPPLTHTGNSTHQALPLGPPHRPLRLFEPTSFTSPTHPPPLCHPPQGTANPSSPAVLVHDGIRCPPGTQSAPGWPKSSRAPGPAAAAGSIPLHVPQELCVSRCTGNTFFLPEHSQPGFPRMGFNSCASNAVPQWPQFPSWVIRSAQSLCPQPSSVYGLWHNHGCAGEQPPKPTELLAGLLPTQRQSRGCSGHLIRETRARFIFHSSPRAGKHLIHVDGCAPISTKIAEFFQFPAAGTNPSTKPIHPASKTCSQRPPSPHQCVLSPARGTQGSTQAALHLHIAGMGRCWEGVM